jgi:hypothetical protein
MKVLTFEKALKRAESCTTKHLLLGNGFSIACNPTIFTYNSLYKEANFTSHPNIKKTFERLGTTDFELVIDALEKSSNVLPAYYQKSTSICTKMADDAITIKELLISTISSRHPANPSVIPEERYDKCRRFLSHFIHKSNGGRIYTLNYDLLLYWTLMHELDDEESESKFSDGFGRESWIENGVPQFSEELTWQGKSSYQNIHYLHGGLHLYDLGSQLQKFSWTDTGTCLIDQSRKALQEGKFPLFVTEGDNQKKMEKINHNSYLFTSFRSFEDMANSGKSKNPGNTCLFTYGVSFSDNDKHIFNRIAHGRIKQLYISIFGDSKSGTNKTIFAKAEAMKSQRDKFPLEIHYFDAASAEVWN